MVQFSEKITDNLRLSHVYHLYAQVLVCLRVLLVRLSAQHLIPIWPTVITELVSVLGMLEEEAAALTNTFDTK